MFPVPAEIAFEILSPLSGKDLKALSLTSKSYHRQVIPILFRHIILTEKSAAAFEDGGSLFGLREMVRHVTIPDFCKELCPDMSPRVIGFSLSDALQSRIKQTITKYELFTNLTELTIVENIDRKELSGTTMNVLTCNFKRKLGISVSAVAHYLEGLAETACFKKIKHIRLDFLEYSWREPLKRMAISDECDFEFLMAFGNYEISWCTCKLSIMTIDIFKSRRDGRDFYYSVSSIDGGGQLDRLYLKVDNPLSHLRNLHLCEGLQSLSDLVIELKSDSFEALQSTSRFLSVSSSKLYMLTVESTDYKAKWHSFEAWASLDIVAMKRLVMLVLPYPGGLSREELKILLESWTSNGMHELKIVQFEGVRERLDFNRMSGSWEIH